MPTIGLARTIDDDLVRIERCLRVRARFRLQVVGTGDARGRDALEQVTLQRVGPVDRRNALQRTHHLFRLFNVELDQRRSNIAVLVVGDRLGDAGEMPDIAVERIVDIGRHVHREVDERLAFAGTALPAIVAEREVAAELKTIYLQWHPA